MNFFRAQGLIQTALLFVAFGGGALKAGTNPNLVPENYSGNPPQEQYNPPTENPNSYVAPYGYGYGYQQQTQSPPTAPSPYAQGSQNPSGPLYNPLRQGASGESEQKQDKDFEAEIDFDNEDAFIDVEEAVRTEHYVRRAILSTVVNTIGKPEFNRFYINHLMGFSAIYQQKKGPIKFEKYTSGMQGLAFGFVTKGGHSLEVGLEFSAVSNVYGGYRYIWRPEHFSMWPFLGVGFGTQMKSLQLSKGPTNAENYDKLGGMQQMGFGSFGVLIPVVEVGIKAEVRTLFYGLNRLVLSSGLGLIVYL
ncbi:MAG: hypothetical protein ACKOA8_18980 [Deltaproteobacteria bacterium]